jgi:hypothetical protein
VTQKNIPKQNQKKELRCGRYHQKNAKTNLWEKRATNGEKKFSSAQKNGEKNKPGYNHWRYKNTHTHLTETKKTLQPSAERMEPANGIYNPFLQPFFPPTSKAPIAVDGAWCEKTETPKKKKHHLETK